MDKKQKDIMTKGFRLLRLATVEGERSAHEDDPEEMLQIIENMTHLIGQMKVGLEHHIGAQEVLKGIETTRPEAAAKIGRPKLRLVKG